MAIIKCKMCGGDLTLTEGQSVAECEYCGSRQTVPAADNEKKLSLFARANRLRAACEFDKAAGIYESIVTDFPEEAEAYWGLVLCKYGIEYVDDPGTGKKIPTCHRSSFESIMDDANFDQALENADAVARKVYREEAKVIEEIRKGIIVVSSNEEPYDIFICYKETAENGDRTLDSVLAQDIYDALTDKGYRPFFARITLEDKLGQEYEPYIFAALNSAKIMLAVGTDYEYYNAVWVKNEWSRYLKLMTADKTKHLIPCYKGIDAYDMPREFAKLQAQDLGKVGAMQDLLRGIEKILPRKQSNTTVIQERVVVGGIGGNKLESLLDRGNMALEDGDWAKADSFFEDVLNNDSKNAQAYLGKTLAQEKCRTIDALARKRKAVSQNVRGEKLYLEPADAHVDEMVEKFSLSGYVGKNKIRDLYTYDLSYHSNVAERKQQYRDEEAYWADHKTLSRAEKFAVGAVAQSITAEKKALFAALSDRVKQAEAAEAAARKDAQERYEKHLAQVDEKAAWLLEEGLARREKDYQALLQTAKTSADVTELTETADKFDRLGDYRDSKNLAEHCRQRAADEQAKIEEEKERQRIIAEKEEARRKAKNKKMLILAGVALAVVLAAILLVNMVVIPSVNYQKAEEALASGNIAEAAILFGTLGDYRDARERSFALWDEIAVREIISVGLQHTVGLKTDGTVVVTGYDYAQRGVKEWTNIVAISAGANHTVGLKADGTVVAVGNNSGGKCDVGNWADVVAISAGDSHTVGLKVDGTVVATGYNNYAQCEVKDWTDIIAVSAGGHHTVGLKADGTVVASGSNSNGQCDVSDWVNIVAVSAGIDCTVGLKADGTVVTAGIDYNSLRNVYSWTDIVAISAGKDHIVGLKADGTAISVSADYSIRCNVYEWTDIVAISAGTRHTVGLRADGTVVAVGDNDAGQCDVSGWTAIRIPGTVDTDEMEASLAADYAAAEELHQSGDYAGAYLGFRALGNYSDAAERCDTLWALILAEHTPCETISVGDRHTVAIRNDGTVVAVGANDYGQCNVGNWRNIVAVSASDNHTVGLRADGTVVAVGNNNYGQCEVSDWTDIVAISTSEHHTVGLKSDGAVVAVGWNLAGECEVDGWTNIVAISAGNRHTVGLRSDGTVVTAGTNEDGQCEVSDWTDIVTISAGSWHTVGLKSDGTVVAVGANGIGQCNIEDWTDIVAISAGSAHTVGLKADGTVVAVGYNGNGQCDVAGRTDIVTISAGNSHTVGLREDGTVVAVGKNDDGQCDVSGLTDIGIPE